MKWNIGLQTPHNLPFSNCSLMVRYTFAGSTTAILTAPILFRGMSLGDNKNKDRAGGKGGERAAEAQSVGSLCEETNLG